MKRCRSFWSIIIILFGFLVSGCSSDSGKDQLHVKILAINDFHGHITKECSKPVGGAPVLAAYLEAAARGFEGRTFIVHAGDLVGGSPAASAELQDEPSLMFLNRLATQKSPGFKIIGTLGNHEFDQGIEELCRLIRGRNHWKGPFLENPYPGAKFPYVCANVVDNNSQPLLKPFIIEKVEGIPLAFIGALTTETRTKCKANLSDLHFGDEVKAINLQVDLLKQRGVRAIIVLIHEGGDQTPYEGKTDPKNPEKNKVTGKIYDIASRLDDEVDVVVSGHTHNFTNAFIKNILVTQAHWHGEAYGDIDLKINRDTKDIEYKRAEIKPTEINQGPGEKPHDRVSQLVKLAEDKVKEIKHDLKEVINEAKTDIEKKTNDFGESLLGNLVADSQKAAGKTRFSFVNLGSIRAEKICQGKVTWGDLYSVQPFKNELVTLELTGENIYQVLEQQWAEPDSPKFLQISGLHYTWREASPGSRIVEVRDDETGEPINKASTYEVTVNNFLAGGGDNFTEFRKGKRIGVVYDLDALVDYIGKLRKPFSIHKQDRIKWIEAQSPATTAASPDETIHPPRSLSGPQGQPAEKAEAARGEGGKFEIAEIDNSPPALMNFTGKLTGQDGRPLSRTTVQFQLFDTTYKAITDENGEFVLKNVNLTKSLQECYIPFILLIPGIFGLVCAAVKDKRDRIKGRDSKRPLTGGKNQQENQFLMALCNAMVWAITLLALALLGVRRLHFFSPQLGFEFYVPILGFLGALLYMFHMFHKGEETIPKGKEFGMRILLAPYVAIIVVVLFGRDLGLVDLQSTAGRGTLAFFSGLLVIAFLQHIIEKGQERLGRWREASTYKASEIAKEFNLSLEEDLKLRAGDLAYLVQLEQYSEEQLREKARKIGFNEYLLVGLKKKCPKVRLKMEIGGLVWKRLEGIGVREIEDFAQLSDPALDELNEGEAKPKIDIAILKNLRDRAREICLPSTNRPSS